MNDYDKRAIGRNELAKFTGGKRITRDEAIKAKCYACNNGYADGVNDCEIAKCPLYGYMPYSPLKHGLTKDKK